jgi:tetratricopeptide (TPR) repeat protein
VSRLLSVAWLAALVACARSPQEALERGDRLHGAGRVDEAIAEYKLALRQNAGAPEVLLRLGAAYGSRGEVEQALRYLEQVVEGDSVYRYEAAAVLADAARAARERGAPDNMARALEPVVALGVGLIPLDLRLSLARFYAGLSDYGRAVPHFMAAGGSDSLPPSYHYETARAFQELGGCREALVHFESYLMAEGVSRADRSGARWQYGTCLFEVAEQEREAGDLRAASRHLDRLIEQGVPRTLLDRAHLARGEILLAQGAPGEAEEHFQAVLRLNPTRSGPVVQLAEERIRQIRYGYR